MKQYSMVRLITNKFRPKGVFNGDIGYIIEIYDDGNYEVEFSNSETGETVALIVASDEDVELAEKDM